MVVHRPVRAVSDSFPSCRERSDRVRVGTFASTAYVNKRDRVLHIFRVLSLSVVGCGRTPPVLPLP